MPLHLVHEGRLCQLNPELDDGGLASSSRLTQRPQFLPPQGCHVYPDPLVGEASTLSIVPSPQPGEKLFGGFEEGVSAQQRLTSQFLILLSPHLKCWNLECLQASSNLPAFPSPNIPVRANRTSLFHTPLGQSTQQVSWEPMDSVSVPWRGC